jgi:hypothetical protein
MQTQDLPGSRIRRTVNDLVMAEMFLVQATIESATAIGEGIEELGKKIADRNETGQTSWESLSQVLQRISDEALEPYTTRYKYFKDMIGSGS